MTSSLAKVNKSSGAHFRALFLKFPNFSMFLNIQIDLLILKTYDGQFTLTTEKSVHIIFNGSLPPGGWLVGWLSVHRDQLRAQLWVTTMGSLCLIYLWRPMTDWLIDWLIVVWLCVPVCSWIMATSKQHRWDESLMPGYRLPTTCYR